MSGWQFKHEERDGRLVSVPIYNNPEDSVCDREEYDEEECELELAERTKNGND